MSERNAGGPAFPAIREWTDSDGYSCAPAGMSLRDFLAANAPNAPEWWINADAHEGLNPRKHEGHFSIAEHARSRAEWAYRYADAMLRARDE